MNYVSGSTRPVKRKTLLRATLLKICIASKLQWKQFLSLSLQPVNLKTCKADQFEKDAYRKDPNSEQPHNCTS